MLEYELQRANETRQRNQVQRNRTPASGRGGGVRFPSSRILPKCYRLPSLHHPHRTIYHFKNVVFLICPRSRLLPPAALQPTGAAPSTTTRLLRRAAKRQRLQADCGGRKKRAMGMMQTSLCVALRTLLRGGVPRRLMTRRRRWERSMCGGRWARKRQDLEEGQRGMRWRRMTKRLRWRLWADEGTGALMLVNEVATLQAREQRPCRDARRRRSCRVCIHV